jgi:hypothetical protein
VSQRRWRSTDFVAFVLAAITLLLFARLAQRHVGESYFLADQVDQLQKYEAALRLEPEGLWGPAMSGTQARALGPFGAIAFGFPVSLGLGINSIHTLTSLLLAAATALAFWQLAQVSVVLASAWLMVFAASRITWWNAAMFWSNTLLLPVGLLLFALFVVALRRPSVTALAGMMLTEMFALQLHLVSLVGLPLVALAIVVTWREALTRRPARSAAVLLIALAGVAVAPYLIAESTTGFQNTGAMLRHVRSATGMHTHDGRTAALETLAMATDPMSLLQPNPAAPIAMGIVFSAVALLTCAHRRPGAPSERDTVARLLVWLVIAAVIAITGQAIFYVAMARPLNGLQYVTFLSPWYAIPPAAAVAGILRRLGERSTQVAALCLAVAALAVMTIRVPALADRYAERTPWNYQAIVTSLDALCAGQGVDTREGQGLVDELTPSYDSVLRYLMKRGFSRCRYQPGSDVVIVASRNGGFAEVLEDGSDRLKRERLLEPGIARYRRVR